MGVSLFVLSLLVLGALGMASHLWAVALPIAVASLLGYVWARHRSTEPGAYPGE